MNEPWNLKKDDKREKNTLTTFIIFCEDKVSEPCYFNYFKTDKIKINLIREQKSMMSNVLNAVHHCTTDGLDLSDNALQVWCVFDKDKDESRDLPIENTEFDFSIRSAEQEGIKIAWSNDAFELWILLHFEDVDINNESYRTRTTYYERLTEIFRGLPNPNDELERIKNNPEFYYKDSLKGQRRFMTLVRPRIEDKITDAIVRAKELETACETRFTHNHQKAPCTKVHHLVEALIAAGGKQIDKIETVS